QARAPGGEGLPRRPVVLAERVLDRQHRVPGDPARYQLAELGRRALAPVQVVAAAGADQVSRGYVQRDAHLVRRLPVCRSYRLGDERDDLLAVERGRAVAALVADQH